MPDFSEAATRQHLIDPRLQHAGWTVVSYSADQPLSGLQACALTEYPTTNGPADYALCLDGRIVGVVEAKKRSRAPQGVLTQAERYARGLGGAAFNFRGFRVPFLYATNGDIIRHHDVRHPLNLSRNVAAFHTPAALRERLTQDFEGACRTVQQMPHDHPRLRPYQKGANEAVEQAIVARKRSMLLAMATGTGKTLTTVNQVYRLMQAGVARRVLFLVDRRALAAQAVRAFASFEAEPGLKFDKIYEVYSQRFRREDLGEDEKFDPKVLPASYLLDPKPGLAFVYVSTIQRMTINLFGQQAALHPDDEAPDEEAETMPIPIHAFDLVVADECHRGYTAAELSIWRKTLQHFDALKIGLTATPAPHTTTFFKHVAFRYGYHQAVLEDHLVDYDEVHIQSGVRMNGVFLQEGDLVGDVDPETGVEAMDRLEDERQFDTSEVEAKVTAPDSNRKILEAIKTYADAHEQETGRFPKTLIFAVNDLEHTSHADQLVALAREVFGRGEAFVRKITGRVDRPLQRIREFRNRPEPGIVVTVDMLTTGVDIPDLEFLVFLRPVKSRILYEQMMGRGTRKGEHHPDKSHFTVFDCFGGTLLDYFRGSVGMLPQAPRKPGRSLAEVIEAIWQNQDRAYNIQRLVIRLLRIDKRMSGDARDLFAAYLPEGDLGRWAKALPERLQHDFTATMALLRNPGFQDLLVHYPRPKRTFLVAYETQDDVSAERVIRDAGGNAYRAEDYLTAFGRFVRENPEQIDAIGILLDRPQAWSTGALTQLRNRLAATPQRFTVGNLQRAHELHYHKALVDIISMVKHAAREEAPLYTAEERVERAFAQVTAGHDFTLEQQQWLAHIRAHLIENLSIDREDFDLLPIFTRAGGWGRARRVFGDRLPRLLHDFNAAIAA